MRVSFNPPRARIVAVVIAAYFIWSFLNRQVRIGTVDLSLPRLDQLHAIGALAILCITIVGLARLMRDR
ncbi:MAG: hypothetical protein HZB26_00515 [Candidatus Hydrogenedentes bacterium]|nr:hypothetical protein [Candidatus Hydrogenedentota bacterium]